MTIFGLVSIMLMGRDPREDSDEPPEEELPRGNPVSVGDKKELGEAMELIASEVKNESNTGGAVATP